METAGALWLAVAASGLYHGLNPGMGWPLAVAAGMMGRGRRDLIAALGPLSLGHLAAMAGVLMPFAIMGALVEWQREIRIGAAALVMAWGLWLLFRRRHPRAIARIPPGRLALWSFAVAMAHGAGLMLVPIYLGLCGEAEAGMGYGAAVAAMAGNVGIALAVALLHAGVMIAAGGACALVVHEWLGLRALSRAWVNLDAVWALSLIAVGGIALAMAL